MCICIIILKHISFFLVVENVRRACVYVLYVRLFVLYIVVVTNILPIDTLTEERERERHRKMFLG